MIEFKNVSKAYDGFTLKDISFCLPKGYIMGLVGTNGAGKTTLLNLLMGVLKPSRGEVIIDGMNYNDNSCEIKDKIGFVLSENVFFNGISLIDNATIFGEYYSKYDRDDFLEWCQKLVIDHKKKYKQLSKGAKLKFWLAFALSHKPEILVLDEPVANFDPEFRKEFFQILADFISDGEHSIILATHLTEDLDKVADYLILLDQGEMLLNADRVQLEDGFRIIKGAEYKVNLLSDNILVNKESNSYGTTALVQHRPATTYDKELEVLIPNIEDLIYHLVKRRGKNRC